MCIVCAEAATGVVAVACAVYQRLRGLPYRQNRCKAEESDTPTSTEVVEPEEVTCSH